MFRRILIPLDGSAFAEAALPAALSMSRRGRGDVRLITVHEPVPAFAYADWDEAARQWAENYLKEVEGRVRPHAGGEVSTAVGEGPVVEEIRRQAEAWNADLVVMATHGRGAVSRVWLGSVADGCIRHGHRPVLLVRPADEASTDLGAALDLKRVVVPLDGSKLAEAALDVGADVAKAFGAPLSLIRAVAFPIGPTSPYLPQNLEMGQEVVDEARQAAARYLKEATTRLRERGLEVDASVATDQNAAHAILEHADADMVVIATHGRSGVGRALLGSVADKVIRGATGPVLALRPEM